MNLARHRLLWLLFFLGVVDGSILAEDHISDYPGVPKSADYEATVTHAGHTWPFLIFQSSCPDYQQGMMNMAQKDRYPFRLFRGRSISWGEFSLTNSAVIQIRRIGPRTASGDGPVRIFPARYKFKVSLDEDGIRFTITRPGQFSLEIGTNGYKRGLMIFADPPETNHPDPAVDNYYTLNRATPEEINSVPEGFSGIYFKRGMHDIGVYHVPAHIKNIYFEAGSWVYGAIIMDGRPGVKIFGRGVLSEAKLNYRQSHVIEALHRSDRIDLEGIVLADTKYFAVRLLGTNNIVKWIKIIGGWTYNTDGIAAFAGSTISHCFIWANDDSIKPYRSDLAITDCVVWQLNNGAVIQLGWGDAKATNVTLRNIDVLHAEWNNDAPNRGILSCIGNKFAKAGMSGSHQNFVVENLAVETPVPFVFNLRPSPASPDQIHGLVLRNWDIKIDPESGFPNYILGADPSARFNGFVFDNFKINGLTLNQSNWIGAGRFVISNLDTPVFTNHLSPASF